MCIPFPPWLKTAGGGLEAACKEAQNIDMEISKPPEKIEARSGPKLSWPSSHGPCDDECLDDVLTDLESCIQQPRGILVYFEVR